MHYILKVNALYTKGKYIIEESMVPVKKSFIHHSQKLFNLIEMTWQAIDDFKLVTVSNTEYKLEMITGLDGIINFDQKFCKSIIISNFLFASFWISQADLI